MIKITSHQYRQAQDDPNFLPWLAHHLDVTARTVTSFIPEEAFVGHVWPFETLPGSFRRFSAIARRIQDRQDIGLSFGHAMACAKFLARELEAGHA